MAVIANIRGESNVGHLSACNSGLTPVRMALPVEKLELGMWVDELDKPWLESSFLFQGFFIESDDELKALSDECDHVYITMARQADTTDAEVYEWPRGKAGRRV